jgi:hypothetical protein
MPLSRSDNYGIRRSRILAFGGAGLDGPTSPWPVRTSPQSCGWCRLDGMMLLVLHSADVQHGHLTSSGTIARHHSASPDSPLRPGSPAPARSSIAVLPKQLLNTDSPGCKFEEIDHRPGSTDESGETRAKQRR